MENMNHGERRFSNSNYGNRSNSNYSNKSRSNNFRNNLESGNYRDSGIIFKNKFKNKEKQPDYVGSVRVNGVEYKLAGWKKEDKKDPKSSYIRFLLSRQKE